MTRSRHLENYRRRPTGSGQAWIRPEPGTAKGAGNWHRQQRFTAVAAPSLAPPCETDRGDSCEKAGGRRD